jgi:hypothetical protein
MAVIAAGMPYAIATFKAARPPRPVEPGSIDVLLLKTVRMIACRSDESAPGAVQFK